MTYWYIRLMVAIVFILVKEHLDRTYVLTEGVQKVTVKERIFFIAMTIIATEIVIGYFLWFVFKANTNKDLINRKQHSHKYRG